jgi:hypothetical protein
VAINGRNAIERLICTTNLSLPLFLSGLSRHTKAVQSCERKKYGDVRKTRRKYDGRAGAHGTTIIADQDTDQAMVTPPASGAMILLSGLALAAALLSACSDWMMTILGRCLLVPAPVFLSNRK